MELFVARQPIYTKEKTIFAYELLYRQSQINHFSEVIDGDDATTEVLINSYFNIGLESLSNGNPCFINFTDNLLRLKLPTYFNPKDVIIEVLETVPITQEIIDLLIELKSKNYTIALDDFVLPRNNPFTHTLLQLADIIKVDVQATPVDLRLLIENIAKDYGLKLLAEKVESAEEFEHAIAQGYDFFQGYFFSRPHIVSTHDLPDVIQNYFVILSHLQKEEPDFNYISQLIEQDLSLTFKLLKVVNSVTYRGIRKIDSIKQAVIRLGIHELTKWLYILSLRGNVTEQKNDWSTELYLTSLTRAKMCELIAKKASQSHDSASFFLTGLFSLIDALLGIEMNLILESLPLEDEIIEALKGKENHLNQVLHLSEAIEAGDWDQVDYWCQFFSISEHDAMSSYNEAFSWAYQIL